MPKPLAVLILGFLCVISCFSCSKKSDTNPRYTSRAEYISVPESSPPELIVQTPENQIAKAMPPRKFIADNVLKSLADKPQEFQIINAEPNAITCAKGSVLNFDANSFVFSDNPTEIPETVDLSITEYITDADFIMAGLSTKCNKELLESGGMLFISASANNRECTLAEGAYYEIALPTDVNKDGMELFYSDNDGKNWLPANRGRFIDAQTTNTYFPTYNKNGFFVEQKKYTGAAEFPGGLKSMYNYLHEKVLLPDGFEFTQLKATCYVNFTLNEHGKIINVYTPKQIKTYGDKDVVKAFKEMPNWEVDIAPGRTKKTMMPVKMDLIRDPSKITIREKTIAKPEVIRTNAKYESDKFILTASQLGWINCDRFIENTAPRITVFVPMDSLCDVTVTMVFNSINSVVGAYRYSSGFYFDSVPEGESVTLIALRINEKGEQELAVQKLVTSGFDVPEFEFVKTDKEGLKQQFEQLSNSRQNGLTSL